MKLQTLPWTRCEALWVWFTSVDTFAHSRNGAVSDASAYPRNGVAHAVELELTIERMSYGADAIAHTADGKTVFASGGAVPGDVVRARLTDDGERFSRATLTEVLEPSPERITSPLPFVALTGAAPWGNMTYESQLREKKAGVVSALERIGHFSPKETSDLVRDIVAPGEPWGYRNKIELAFKRVGRKTLVGMYAPNGQDIVRIKDCPLLDKAHEKIVGAVSGALSYLSGSHELDIERIGIRTSRRTKDVEVALWTAPGGFPRAQVARVLEDATGATSIVRVMTKGSSKARRIAGVERLSGAGSWSEFIGDERMRVSAPSFFQVNTKGAEKLVELVLSALDVRDSDEAMDLYCGAGTFTLPLARRTGFVSAVESYGPAVRDLRRNLDDAGLTNVDAIGGDAGRSFPDTDADVIVVDPPRAGLAPDVVKQLSEQSARAIAYVSCDPATLARDLRRFVDVGTFKPVSVTPVDLFPQTFHVENVCLLVLRNPVTHINIDVDVDVEEMVQDKRGAATYEQIRDYVKEQTGLHVTNLNIAQIKRKCRIIKRQNYNLPKSEDSKQPNCTKEKEDAIMEAFKHFGLL